jgi:hypothetical protein
MSEQALVQRKMTAPTEAEFQVMQGIARNAAASGLYVGVGSEQKILMILLAARELGVGPMTALNGGIWNIQGKIEMSARLMAALIRKAGHSFSIKVINDAECTVEGKRSDNGDSFAATFTIHEAQRAGLLRPGGTWAKYPQDMLYARAFSRLARRLFADVIGNAYIEGEIRETTGKIIRSEPENEMSPEEIDAYLDSFDEDRESMVKYLQIVCQLRNWTPTVAIEQFKKDPKATTIKFENWKKKQIN